jgi:hypothetical protein
MDHRVKPGGDEGRGAAQMTTVSLIAGGFLNRHARA